MFVGGLNNISNVVGIINALQVFEQPSRRHADGTWPTEDRVTTGVEEKAGGGLAHPDPALGAQAGAVLDAAAGDEWFHAEVPDEAAVLVVVVSAVRQDHVRAAPGPAALAAHWRHDCEQWDQLA
ncbi:hypothetical protein GCM10010297_17560 [Streptomyces malachitofuscus]|nr:hypothetical protein GCM10010297_17560 [Streptomyces malachitofuscus]